VLLLQQHAADRRRRACLSYRPPNSTLPLHRFNKCATRGSSLFWTRIAKSLRPSSTLLQSLKGVREFMLTPCLRLQRSFRELFIYRNVEIDTLISSLPILSVLRTRSTSRQVLGLGSRDTAPQNVITNLVSPGLAVRPSCSSRHVPHAACCVRCFITSVVQVVYDWFRPVVQVINAQSRPVVPVVYAWSRQAVVVNVFGLRRGQCLRSRPTHPSCGPVPSSTSSILLVRYALRRLRREMRYTTFGYQIGTMKSKELGAVSMPAAANKRNRWLPLTTNSSSIAIHGGLG
jgi:hypothetical protein